jgi:hypothetical protein
MTMNLKIPKGNTAIPFGKILRNSQIPKSYTRVNNNYLTNEEKDIVR